MHTYVLHVHIWYRHAELAGQVSSISSSNNNDNSNNDSNNTSDNNTKNMNDIINTEGGAPSGRLGAAAARARLGAGPQPL